jgi:hypothetical protein
MAAELVVGAVDIAIDGRVGRLRFAAQREGAATSAGTGMASRRSATSAWAFAASSPGAVFCSWKATPRTVTWKAGGVSSGRKMSRMAADRRPRLARNGRRSARGRGRSGRRCSRRGAGSGADARDGGERGRVRERRKARAARPGRRGRGRRARSRRAARRRIMPGSISLSERGCECRSSRRIVQNTVAHVVARVHLPNTPRHLAFPPPRK